MGDSLPDMGVLRKPDARTCELCGRSEVWDGGWRIAEEDGKRLTGNTYCIHEWDITGEFTPVETS